jgi:hypothetical protein
MVYNVKEVYIVYQKNGFKKRENTDQSISLKTGIMASTYTSSLHVEEVGNYENVLYCNN